ncbi:glucanotransferase [Clostridiales bacterium COT073_COT-073]|nr:glucanotransferase [Clostridiales bacterium COT073_COT-073]
MKKYSKIVMGIGVLLIIFGSCRTSNSQSYRVLIGLSAEKVVKCRNIDRLVIDADLLLAEEVTLLHQNGNRQVLSYLNIGAIEDFRTDYDKYQGIVLGMYENWPEERWVDISQICWQERIRQKVREMVEKGIDGFFLDNADIYYYYQRPEIYQSLLTILTQIKETQKQVIINGGDFFIKTAIEKGDLNDLVDGINQETVFTTIDFSTGSFQAKSAEEKRYFQDYLKQCQDYGLQVYLLEYGADKKLAEEIKTYCQKNGFLYDIAQSIELDQY